MHVDDFGLDKKKKKKKKKICGKTSKNSISTVALDAVPFSSYEVSLGNWSSFTLLADEPRPKAERRIKRTSGILNVATFPCSAEGQACGSKSLKRRTVYRGPVNERLKLPLVVGRETEMGRDGATDYGSGVELVKRQRG